MMAQLPNAELVILDALRGNLKKGGVEFTFSGKEEFIGLYFSASWCPPCRAFTPHLKRYYDKVKHGEDCDSFEIVFISNDSDQESFEEYFREMPWVALDFRQSELKERLAAIFEVHGYPTLVILDRDGQLITKNGRTCVMDNRSTASLAWN